MQWMSLQFKFRQENIFWCRRETEWAFCFEHQRSLENICEKRELPLMAVRKVNHTKSNLKENVHRERRDYSVLVHDASLPPPSRRCRRPLMCPNSSDPRWVSLDHRPLSSDAPRPHRTALLRQWVAPPPVHPRQSPRPIQPPGQPGLGNGIGH